MAIISRQGRHVPCREKAKGATFFEATEGETVRPMLDVSWAPMLGAFSVVFEEFHEGAMHSIAPETSVSTLQFFHGRDTWDLLSTLPPG